MKRKLDTMFTKGLMTMVYYTKFMCSPYKTVMNHGTLEDVHEKVNKCMRLKYEGVWE